MERKLKPIIFSPVYNKPREGRGFSLKELEEAGLSLYLAKRLKIPIDRRRRSFHKENVDKIKEILSTSKAH
ncbi:MAG: ribosomal protein L13e [Nitrososphaeria archaeon]